MRPRSGPAAPGRATRRRERWRGWRRGCATVLLLGLMLAACSDSEEPNEDASETESPSDAAAGETFGGFAADAVDFPLDAAGDRRQPGPCPADSLRSTSSSCLAAGTYVVGLLGTEVQFTTTAPWGVGMARDGALILEWPDAPAPFARALLMFRPVGPAAGPEVYDPDGTWIDELDDVEVLDRSQTTIGDTDVISVDVTASAGAGEIPFLDAPGYGGTIVLRDSEVARVWIIDQGGSPPTPMMFFAPSLTDDTEWLSEADAVVQSMVLGPVEEPLVP